MLERKSWEEFRETGLLLYINQILHVFGWAITVELDEKGNTINVYPARVKYRGFNINSVSKSYLKISNYLKKNIDDLVDEASDI